MKQFKLYIYINTTEKILITDFPTRRVNLTFDEKLVEDQNNKYSLSFTISSDVQIEDINFSNLFKIGKKIELEVFDPFKKVDFIISSISPQFNSTNNLWLIQAEDYASYIFSKNNIGLEIDTIEGEDFLEYIANLPIPESEQFN
jgi:hypothetical protein